MAAKVSKHKRTVTTIQLPPYSYHHTVTIIQLPSYSYHHTVTIIQLPPYSYHHTDFTKHPAIDQCAAGSRAELIKLDCCATSRCLEGGWVVASVSLYIYIQSLPGCVGDVVLIVLVCCFLTWLYYTRQLG